MKSYLNNIMCICTYKSKFDNKKYFINKISKKKYFVMFEDFGDLCKINIFYFEKH